MKLKASVDYGVRTVIYLAVKGVSCSSREIADAMSVPRDYLIQLGLKLRNAGIIKTRPGKNGGYVLAKAPSDITIGSVLDAFDNDLKHARRPMKKGARVSEPVAMVRDAHNLVMEGLNSYLAALSLQDVLDALEADEQPETFIARTLRAEANRLDPQ